MCNGRLHATPTTFANPISVVVQTPDRLVLFATGIRSRKLTTTDRDEGPLGSTNSIRRKSLLIECGGRSCQ